MRGGMHRIHSLSANTMLTSTHELTLCGLILPLQPRLALSGLLGLPSVRAPCRGTMAPSLGTAQLGAHVMWWRVLPTQRGPAQRAVASQATLAPSRGTAVHGAALAEVCLSV